MLLNANEIGGADPAKSGQRWLRTVLWLVVLLLVPVAWLSMQHDSYAIDGDAVAYMDIADLIRTHQWAGVINAYWHPLYPAALLLGQWLFHPSRAAELGAYYRINFLIFLIEAVAVLAFTTALCRLRESTLRVSPDVERRAMPLPLLSADGMRLLGLALLVVASQRELTLGKVRPDALLQALLLFAFSAMLTLCRPLHGSRVRSGRTDRDTIAGSWQYGAAALMGIAFGFAYLTKSFALPVALLSITAAAAAQWLLLKRALRRTLSIAAVTATCFALVAGPYVAALSRQKHRLDFGDSGSLNYAWYVAGTEKFHLEPWQTDRFGSSTVKLLHPERQVMQTPGVYSYRALPWGTLPVWFDASFFNERIVTHVRPGELLHHDVRNVVLVLRYLLNHPEGWVLLLLLLGLGARWRRGSGFASQSFALLPVAVGLAMWCIYGLVNVEERYVTVAYLMVVLPVFAALQAPAAEVAGGSVMGSTGARHRVSLPVEALPFAAGIAVSLLCLLELGESVRTALDLRRLQSVRGIAHGWQDSPLFAVAQGVERFHLSPGTSIACVGTIACLYDPYWMRLAQVRTTTEVFMDHDRVAEAMASLPNRPAVYGALRAEGAPILVGHFDTATLLTGPLAGEGWQRLGRTDFFALPLTGLPDAAGRATVSPFTAAGENGGVRP